MMNKIADMMETAAIHNLMVLLPMIAMLIFHTPYSSLP